MYNLYDVTKEKTNVLGFWKDENGKIFINQVLCSGCGVCVHVCPVHAIQVEE